MRTCTFILPTAVVEGCTVLADVAWLCGGYTALPGRGGWIGDHGELVEEPVTVVTVAVRDEAAASDLLTLALRHAVAAKELALYWQGLSGEVEIINTLVQG